MNTKEDFKTMAKDVKNHFELHPMSIAEIRYQDGELEEIKEVFSEIISAEDIDRVKFMLKG